MNRSIFLPSKLTLSAVGLMIVLLTIANITCDKSGTDGPGKRLDFPKHLTADIPPDVDTTYKVELEKERKFDDVQRLFDLHAWKTFIAVNWPTGADGKPKAKLSDAGLPVWSGWKESFEVYKPDGSAPAPWGGDRALNNLVLGHENLPADGRQKANRVLFRDNKHKEMAADTADELDQAFTGGIWDQNGNLVLYEVLMNETEFNYVVTNKLYNLNDQIAFSQGGGKVMFPSGTFGTTNVGAVEIKISWKVIDPEKDIVSRYLTIDGYIPDPKGYIVNNSSCKVTIPDNTPYIKVKLGMVGMHIAQKTTSSPQWIWSTFEHVDNLTADPTVTGQNSSGKTVGLHSSFYNPDCLECLPNTCAEPGADGKRRSQIMRLIPIPGDKRALNAQAAHTLGHMNSVLQYYELIDTQWPTDPSAPPTPPGNGVASVTNKAGGNVTPVFLTNSTMETYFQTGVTMAYNMEESYGLPPIPTAKDSVLIFGTESCTGCHYSASVAIGDTMVNSKRQAIFGRPQSADFSWLITTQAHFKTQ